MSLKIFIDNKHRERNKQVREIEKKITPSSLVHKTAQNLKELPVCLYFKGYFASKYYQKKKFLANSNIFLKVVKQA